MSNSNPLSTKREVSLPPLVVDTSSWVGQAGVGGESVVPVRSHEVNLGPVELEWIEPKSLEIQVQFGEDASLDVVQEHLLQLINAVAAAAPELKLLYDEERTVAVSGEVRVVLTSQVPLKDDHRLEDLAAVLDDPVPAKEQGIEDVIRNAQSEGIHFRAKVPKSP